MSMHSLALDSSLGEVSAGAYCCRTIFSGGPQHSVRPSGGVESAAIDILNLFY